MSVVKNVLGTELQLCSRSPITGFHRDGCCRVGKSDFGVHAICARVTEAFLQFSKAQGNDLSTPRPQMGFAGLKPGDQWCLCAMRWKEALEAGVAPPVILGATEESALALVNLDALKRHALDLS